MTRTMQDERFTKAWQRDAEALSRNELADPHGLLGAHSDGDGGTIVRAWRPGDRMAPLGLNGTKSLQDLFTARRVPRLQRRLVPVVEARGEIAWVARVATSERFKVRADTREAVRLSCRTS